jgi:enolase-phosphatase E1
LSPSAILLDIEGTIGDITFVRDVLFSYAAQRFEDYLNAHWDEPAIQALIGELGDEGATPLAAAALLQDWSAKDLKRKPLKDLQGMIWAQGYADGSLRSHLYADAVEALHAWARAHLGVWIYSSGSIAAQKLYFKHAEAGDLSPLLQGYFDTTSGSKREAPSYQRIADSIGRAPGDILFLTDVVEEAQAAFHIGMGAGLIDRSKPVDWSAPSKPIASYGSLLAVRKVLGLP